MLIKLSSAQVFCKIKIKHKFHHNLTGVLNNFLSISNNNCVPKHHLFLSREICINFLIINGNINWIYTFLETC